jgi:hypothetical protein
MPFVQNWDDLLRLAGSLKLGLVQAGGLLSYIDEEAIGAAFSAAFGRSACQSSSASGRMRPRHRPRGIKASPAGSTLITQENNNGSSHLHG